MCSIVMPADYEMLVSHSPPVYSHSPPTGYLSSNYSSFRYEHDAFPIVSRGFCRSATSNSVSYNHNSINNTKASAKMPASPKRPCLVIRAEDTQCSSDEDPTSPTRLKKKVVFADDRGMSLTHVRVMTEPSNVPPFWSLRFLAQVTQGISAEPVAADEPWEITFSQPASDYVDFRKRLDTNKVSLENVIIKESEEVLVGTIKVKNLSFEKEVFVRSSFDQWKTHEDSFCKFVPTCSTAQSSAAYVVYDTFSFKVTLPPKSRRLEFCVCFQCKGEEYWDNNSEQNYVLLKKVHNKFHKSYSSEELTNKKVHEQNELLFGVKYSDALHAKVESWSEFATWHHLDNSNPYCLYSDP